jgi:hypothetical protein
LPDAGTARAHALFGITGARAQAIEVAQTGGVRLDVQPGDVLGRTGARSPIDARLDANHSRVSVWLRGQVLLDDVEGLALVFFTTRGDLLGWRAGRSPAHLDGPALGLGSLTRAVAMTALPCMDVQAGRDSDLSALTHDGALGVTWARPGRLDLTLQRPHGWTEQGVRLAATVPLTAGPTLVEAATSPDAFTLQGGGGQSAGVYLRGPVVAARARADVQARVCAAWPMPLALAPPSTPIEMMLSPRYEPYFGAGWHEMEVQPGTGHFRWMSGPRATVLIALQQAGPFTFALDAQAPTVPTAGDQVRLSVGGHDLGAFPLLPTRGMYTWEVPADAVRAGVNGFTIDTTSTVRPADGQHGGDPRRLGLLVRGWILGPAH